MNKYVDVYQERHGRITPAPNAGIDYFDKMMRMLQNPLPNILNRDQAGSEVKERPKKLFDNPSEDIEPTYKPFK